MNERLPGYLRCPAFVCAGLVLFSALSLGAALTGQYAFGLEPCVLCVYQRIPFVAVIAFGLAGLAAARRAPVISKAAIALSGTAFAVNAGIAFYHSGVERHWWKGFEGCSSVEINAASPADILAQIRAAPVVPCDEIPWADPWLGLSMANLNVMACGIAALGCALGLWLMSRRRENRQPAGR